MSEVTNKNYIEQERNIVMILSLENMHEFLIFIKKGFSFKKSGRSSDPFVQA